MSLAADGAAALAGACNGGPSRRVQWRQRRERRVDRICQAMGKSAGTRRSQMGEEETGTARVRRLGNRGECEANIVVRYGGAVGAVQAATVRAELQSDSVSREQPKEDEDLHHGQRYVGMPQEPEASAASFRLPESESVRLFGELSQARIVAASRPNAGDFTPSCFPTSSWSSTSRQTDANNCSG